MNSFQCGQQDAVILIIDHEPGQGAAMAATLRHEGYQVQVESSGQTGLAYWQQHQPAVLICDLATPEIDGPSIIKTITAASVETQVIVLAQADQMQDVLAALRLGAVDYLFKPVQDQAMFLHAVRRASDACQLLRENRQYRETLEAKNRELAESLRLLKEDQEAGRAVQLKMLPEPSQDFGNVHIEYTIIPSLYLSGDFVDYFRLGADQIGFYLADVSGHGASSAFMTVLLKNLANRIKQRYREDFANVQDVLPADVLERFNRELIPLGLGKHLAIFCGLIDLRAKRLVYCSAAHLPPPILVTNGKTQALEGRGLPVGLFDEATYENQEVELGEAFDLVIFSDGVLELVPAPSVAEKEKHLMAMVEKGIHNIAQLRVHLGLQDLQAVPDDIAIMTVSCRAVTHRHG